MRGGWSGRACRDDLGGFGMTFEEWWKSFSCNRGALRGTPTALARAAWDAATEASRCERCDPVPTRCPECRLEPGQHKDGCKWFLAKKRELEAIKPMPASASGISYYQGRGACSFEGCEHFFVGDQPEGWTKVFGDIVCDRCPEHALFRRIDG